VLVHSCAIAILSIQIMKLKKKMGQLYTPVQNVIENFLLRNSITGVTGALTC